MSAKLTTSLEFERRGRVDEALVRSADGRRVQLERGGLLLVTALLSCIGHVAMAVVVATTPTEIDIDPLALLPPPEPVESAPLPMAAAVAIPEQQPEEAIEEPEPVAEPEPEPEPEVVEAAAAPPPPAEPVAEPEPEPEPKKVAEPEPEPAPREVAEPEPEPTATAMAEPIAAPTDDPAAPPAQPTTDEPVAAAAHVPGTGSDAPADARPPSGKGSSDAAPTRATARPSPRGVPGSNGVDVDGLQQAWLGQINDALHGDYPYPRAARRRGLEGRVKLKIWIDGAGRITKIKLHASSGHDVLDEAAIAAVTTLGRVPAPPGEIGWTTRAMIVPFDYSL